MEKTAEETKNTAAQMELKAAKEIVHQLAALAGVTINGSQPWDMQIHNEQTYTRIVNEGSLGLGESYMDGWWDCQQLDLFFDKILHADLDTQLKIPLHVKTRYALSKMINMQTKKRAKEVARVHYDLGNDLFKCMLDKRLIYSCAYFKNTHDLDEAQEAKLDLICQKLQLKSGMHLLDIGCGWGGLAKYAAKKYGVKVVGVTISEQQYEYAKESCKDLPIEIRLQDYRDISEIYDRVVSVGMFEHVGPHNYDTFMQIAHKTLSEKGLFLLHTIGSNQTSSAADDWINKYIFPNGCLPSIQQIGKATEPYFVMEDWQNFGGYYDLTLMAWHKRFNSHWDTLKTHYDERFYRMWTYYLLSCAATFRSRSTQLWQIVLTKKGREGVYISPR